MANRIRMFWILLLENRSQNNIFLLQYIINLSFNGLAQYARTFCSLLTPFSLLTSLLVFFLAPAGLGKNTTQLAKYPHVLYAKPSNKLYVY